MILQGLKAVRHTLRDVGEPAVVRRQLRRMILAEGERGSNNTLIINW